MLEFGSFKEGDSIDVATLEKRFGCLCDTAEYNFRALKLAKAIEKHLRRLGRPLTIVCQKGAIVALTASEALTYQTRWYANRKRGLRRNHRMLVSIDCKNLSDEEREKQLKHIIRQSQELMAIREVGSMYRLDPHDANLPKRSQTRKDQVLS